MPSLPGSTRHAAAEEIPLLALKDITHRDNLWAQAPLAAAGFTAIPTLPVATLHLPFASVEAYLDSLSANMRSSLKKKMKHAADVDIELRQSIDGIESEMTALFDETHAHRKSDYGAFDDVPPSVLPRGAGQRQRQCARHAVPHRR